MEPLSEVALGLLDIKNPIQAVWGGGQIWVKFGHVVVEWPLSRSYNGKLYHQKWWDENFLS